MVSNKVFTPLVRERETYRYLDLSYVHGYVDNTNDPIPPARPSRDSALTAFAQLGLLRLGAHRAFVSLFDRRYQYVIAETTAFSGLRSSAAKPTEEGLLLCGLAFPYTQGVSSHVIDAASESLVAGEDNSEWRAPVQVVPDVQADERFAASHLLKLYQDIRFYAAVPIRSPAGCLIGVFSVTDSKPRETLSAMEMDFLRSTSLTIMDHLVMVRCRQEEARGKRMLRGLGSFVEGGATMTGLDSDEWSTRPRGDAGQEGMLNVAQQAKMRAEVEHVSAENTTTSRDMQATQSYFSPEILANTTVTPNSAERRAPGGAHLPQHLSLSASRPSPQAGSSASPVKSVPLTETPSPASSTENIRSLFSRAANTIRESIEVEGVLFFDASVTTFGGMIDSGRHDSSDTGQSYSSRSSSSGEESLHSAKSERNATLYNDKTCEIFGFSTTETSSIDNDRPDAKHLTVPERFLRLLLRRYPNGKIFNFDENGIPLSDTESDSEHNSSTTGTILPTDPGPSRNRRHRQQSFARSREPSFIIRIFPNARSVIPFPLWDSNKARWYAGGVAWTRTPSRVFSVRGELSYLRAFGATIMAEVAKIDTQQANQAKADVLGSISHELRSPLHGILGGVELLQETSMDVFQDSTVHTIARCGTTLLDTVDHLLDYAKVNNLMQASRAARNRRLRGARASAKMEGSSITEAWDVDVDAIVEEVVESVFAGHEFEMSSQSLDAPQTTLKSHDPNVRHLDAEMLSKQDPPVSDTMSKGQVKVILDIRPAVSWKFSTQVGALRRVLMNIFGNALKYTAAGQVKVTVDQKDLPMKSTRTSDVKIIVEDTGKGIGEEYLAHHLFTPFSQEDSLSSGTGLGLSITRKIVTSLGGTIDVQSKVGFGSTVSVSLPLTHSASTDTSGELSAFAALVKQTKGLRVSLVGFDETVPSSVQENSEESQGWQLPWTAVAHQCQAWLCMDILPPTATALKPDIYLATLTGAATLADMNKIGVVVQPVVVICPSAAVARQLSIGSNTIERNGIFQYVAQPCGPRKLAKTFTLALDHWADIQIKRASQVPGTVSESSSTSPITQTEEHIFADSNSSARHSGFGPSSSSPSVSSSKLPPNPTDLTKQQVHSLQRFLSPGLGISPNSTPPMLQPASAPPATSTPTPNSDIAPYLVVDDNAINLKLLTTYLSRQNLPVATATDGALAVAAYEAARGAFSCIFMDIQMPHLDGVAATRAIREYEIREGLDPVHIVILTGLASTENIQEAKASGADEFFPKPVRFKTLNPVLKMARKTLRKRKER